MPKQLSKLIAEHKDVNKLVISLNTCMSSFKEEVQIIMKNFTGFSELWEKEPEPTVKEFMTTNPLMVDLEAKFRHYKVNFNIFIIFIFRILNLFKFKKKNTKMSFLNLSLKFYRECKLKLKNFHPRIKSVQLFM